MSVAATSRRLEQYDVIRLQGELLEVAHRLAVDVEFSGSARLPAAQALGALLNPACDRVEQPLILGQQPELDDLSVATAHRAVAAGTRPQLLAIEQHRRHGLDDLHRDRGDTGRIAGRAGS